jgi:hypothetical protein
MRCVLCGRQNEVIVYTSSLSFGPADLDCREGAPARGTSMCAVFDCEGCGYCADDLESASDAAAAVVADPAYRSLVGDREAPGSRYRRLAMIAEAQGDETAAGIAWRAAAWEADDCREPGLARQWRIAAAERLARVQPFSWARNERGAAAIAIADLWRRASEWDKAKLAVARGLSLNPTDDGVRRALKYQARLAVQRDAERHTFGDVPH